MKAAPRAVGPDADRSGSGHWRALLRAASQPYRRAGRFAWHFARGKLGLDPVFRALLESGELPPEAQVLDLGCGQGLLASLLWACEESSRQGHWPAHWPGAPVATRYTGIDLMPRDIERARQSLALLPSAPQFICADMCRAQLPNCDAVVVLDVLHYVDHAAQAALLGQIQSALSARGRLLLRVGDTQRSLRFAISQWVDRVVTRARGHRVAPTWGRTLPQWIGLLEQLGFHVRHTPMSRGTPFANVLLVCERVEAAR